MLALFPFVVGNIHTHIHALSDGANGLIRYGDMIIIHTYIYTHTRMCACTSIYTGICTHIYIKMRFQTEPIHKRT